MGSQHRHYFQYLTACALVLLLVLSPAARAATEVIINGVTIDADGLITNSVHHVLVQEQPASAAAVPETTLAAIRAALQTTVTAHLSRGGLEFLVNVTATETMPASYPAADFIARGTAAGADGNTPVSVLRKMRGSFSMGNGLGGTLFTLQVVQLYQGYIVGGGVAKALVPTSYTYAAAEVNSLVGQADISAAVTAAGGSGTYVVVASRLDQKEGFACYSACKGMIAMAAVIVAAMLATVIAVVICCCCCRRNEVKDTSNERVRKASVVEPITEEQEFYFDEESKKKAKTPKEGIIAPEDTATVAHHSHP